MSARTIQRDDAIERALIHHAKAGVVQRYVRPEGQRSWWLVSLAGDPGNQEMTRSEATAVCRALAAAERFSARTKEMSA